MQRAAAALPWLVLAMATLVSVAAQGTVPPSPPTPATPSLPCGVDCAAAMSCLAACRTGTSGLFRAVDCLGLCVPPAAVTQRAVQSALESELLAEQGAHPELQLAAIQTTAGLVFDVQTSNTSLFGNVTLHARRKNVEYMTAFVQSAIPAISDAAFGAVLYRAIAPWVVAGSIDMRASGFVRFMVPRCASDATIQDERLFCGVPGLEYEFRVADMSSGAAVAFTQATVPSIDFLPQVLVEEQPSVVRFSWQANLDVDVRPVRYTLHLRQEESNNTYEVHTTAALSLVSIAYCAQSPVDTWAVGCLYRGHQYTVQVELGFSVLPSGSCVPRVLSPNSTVGLQAAEPGPLDVSVDRVGATWVIISFASASYAGPITALNVGLEGEYSHYSAIRIPRPTPKVTLLEHPVMVGHFPKPHVYVANLHPANRYTLTLWQETAAGVAPASMYANVTFLTESGAPGAVARPMYLGSAIVSWLPPEVSNGAIEGYDVELGEELMFTRDTALVISDLQGLVSVRVRARTQSAAGPWSQALVVVVGEAGASEGAPRLVVLTLSLVGCCAFVAFVYLLQLMIRKARRKDRFDFSAIAEAMRLDRNFIAEELAFKGSQMVSTLNAGEQVTCHKAALKGANRKLEIVVVRALNRDAAMSRDIFFRQAAVLAQLKHDNVLALIGVVSTQGRAWMVLEHCELRTLKEHLDSQGPHCSPRFRLQVALDVASGMSYLQDQAFVHRNLRAKSVFVSANFRAKIGKLSMAEKVGDCGFFSYMVSATHGNPRWACPVAVETREHSFASDVWSLGVTLFELYSNGECPYKSLRGSHVLAKVAEGFRLRKTKLCPIAVYALMKRCWQPSPTDRPSFAELRDEFGGLLALENGPQGPELEPLADLASSTNDRKLSLRPKSLDAPSFFTGSEGTLLDDSTALGRSSARPSLWADRLSTDFGIDCTPRSYEPMRRRTHYVMLVGSGSAGSLGSRSGSPRSRAGSLARSRSESMAKRSPRESLGVSSSPMLLRILSQAVAGSSIPEEEEGEIEQDPRGSAVFGTAKSSTIPPRIARRGTSSAVYPSPLEHGDGSRRSMASSLVSKGSWMLPDRRSLNASVGETGSWSSQLMPMEHHGLSVDSASGRGPDPTAERWSSASGGGDLFRLEESGYVGSTDSMPRTGLKGHGFYGTGEHCGEWLPEEGHDTIKRVARAIHRLSQQNQGTPV